MLLWNKIDLGDNNTQFILKYKQYKNTNIANFVYCGKTWMFAVLVWDSRRVLFHVDLRVILSKAKIV